MIETEITDFDIEELSKLIADSDERIIPKNEIFMMPNSIHKSIYFIVSGLVRTFYFDSKGGEITHWFGGKNTIAGVISSFITQKSTPYALQALEDTKVKILSYEKFVELYNTSHEFVKIASKFSVKRLIEMSDKLVVQQTKTAKERYDLLLENHSDIFQKAKLKYIASYLGITQQSLSRIRIEK
ncbi:MAG: Crp/Fnr family transcriptional regulator [Rhodothermaceae bacterium]